MRVYDVEVLLDGETHIIPIDEELTLLEGIEEYGKEVLYSCRAGVCITCAAKLLSGEVDPGFASITDELKDEGYVLACSAYPRSEGIKLEMNHFDDAYNKQYGRYEAGTAK
ncbi:Ferredoxin-2 [Gracilariopsis chorda]|uniref:Ferredoxin-2 n=1 Tax=Gracilariopsis chorda TaxID=448386 RepID=A0A2V3J3W3_9FLOR|nr:Ferredoxin-2 [Gracilariopsis chorda]|eukprot:PXF48677.1 Ferredoxin-2 [Gracilariopsis chorda]